MAIKYTYYAASTDLHPYKPGINRITWEDNDSIDPNEWTEITREYFPEDPRDQPSAVIQAWNEASPEEKQQLANELKQYLNL